MAFPPRASGSHQKVGGEVHLFSSWNMQCCKLALQGTQPIISIQRLLGESEGGRLGPQKVNEVVTFSIPLGTLLHQLFEQSLAVLTVYFNGH